MLKRHFDPRKSFFELTVVKATFVVIVALSIFFALVIIYNSDLKSDLSYSGFNNFLEIFKVPLGTFALLIPSVALLAANHRSEQTREQILTAQSQNNFSNYFKHIEEFEKFCNEQNFNKAKVVNVRRLHDVIFGGAKEGIYDVCEQFREDIDSIISDFFRLCEAFEYEDSAFKLDNILELDTLKKTIMAHYGISLSERRSGNNLSHNNRNVFFADGKLELFLKEFKVLIQYVILISRFGGKAIKTDKTEEICNIMFSCISSDNISVSKNFHPFNIKDFIFVDK